jgi:hypothetical protein
LKFRPLVVGGICCWLLSICAAISTSEFHLLFLAAGVIIAWIIPGYMMRSKFKKQQLA